MPVDTVNSIQYRISLWSFAIIVQFQIISQYLVQRCFRAFFHFNIELINRTKLHKIAETNEEKIKK